MAIWGVLAQAGNGSLNGTVDAGAAAGGAGLDAFGWRLLASGITIALAIILTRIAGGALTRSARRIARMRRLDDQKTKAAIGRTRPLRLLVGILLAVMAALSLLAIWELSGAFTGLLAGAGFAGIVIGLAAADTIGDVIAGFLIFYNHPFDIGDWVEIDGVQGYIEDVALGATTLLTFDNEKVTFPNRLVEGGKIRNFSHARRLRIRIPVGVEYGSDLQRALAVLVDIAAAHPDVLPVPKPMAVITGFGASSVDLELRPWVEPVRASVIMIRTDILRQIHDRFRAEGIGIAFPHMQVVQGRPWRIDHDTEAAA